ncbi:MAG TPA: RIP metalloprotease RseP [Candidatus Eisenbacteria bacterium]
MFKLILFGVPALGLVVLVHELGHFLMARLCRVPVDKFSIGFGPRLLGWTSGRTEYALSAIPLGGYVKMAGEEALEEGVTPGPDTFLGHPWWHRVLIALAGPGANFVFAFVVLTLLYLTGVSYPDSSNVVGRVTPGSTIAALDLRPGDVVVEVAGKPTTRGGEVRLGLAGGEQVPHRKNPVDMAMVVERNGARVPVAVSAGQLNAVIDSLLFYTPAIIGDVVSGTPAYVAGLRNGDTILSIEGEPVGEWIDVLERISARPDQPTRLVVRRDGKEINLSVTPLRQEENGRDVGRIGVVVQSREYKASYPIGTAIQYGAAQTVGLSGAQFAAIGGLVMNPKAIGRSMSGPLAIMEMTGQAAERGVDELFRLVALISIALMAFNLLPIPVLDGGLVVMALAEGIRRRPVPIKVQVVFQQIGLVMLGSLILFVLFNDPMKMIRRNRALSQQQKSAPAATSPAHDEAPAHDETPAPAADSGSSGSGH